MIRDVFFRRRGESVGHLWCDVVNFSCEVMAMSVPRDPMILLSYINTQLRDNYSNLDELCRSLDLDKIDLVIRLKEIQYEYDPMLNRFL